MVEEMAKQLPWSGSPRVKPDAIFCSVGGGGLIGGILEGRDRVGWLDGTPCLKSLQHDLN
jgi:L-serine/L-threonine ammonia-lyase